METHSLAACKTATGRPLFRIVAVMLSFVSSVGTQTGRAQDEDPLSVPDVVFTSERGGVYSCGTVEDDPLAPVRRIADAGRAVLPGVEAALDSIEKLKGEFQAPMPAPLLVYAQIEKRAGSERLRRMLRNPYLRQVRYDAVMALALSLGLTSYIYGDQGEIGGALCGRFEEPRNALDHLILAWEDGNRAGLEETLGPAARSAMDRLLDREDWQALRRRLWRGKSGERVAVGYRFEGAGKWSQPPVDLDTPEVFRDAAPKLVMTPVLETEFTNAGGRKCKVRAVQFLAAGFVEWLVGQHDGPRGPHPAFPYVVNTPDMEDLLRTISSCASLP